MDKIKKLREIFLAQDVDEEERQENLQDIIDFEKSLALNNARVEWLKQDISQELIKTLKVFVHKVTRTLGTNSDLSEEDRRLLFAKRMAGLWLLTVVQGNPEEEIKNIEHEIDKALENVDN